MHLLAEQNNSSGGVRCWYVGRRCGLLKPTPMTSVHIAPAPILWNCRRGANRTSVGCTQKSLEQTYNTKELRDARHLART